MIYIQLFWSFVKIGFTSFGGLSMIPLVTEEMLSHGWMTAAEVTDIIAISEMTPGPIGLNCASFAGMKSAGILGALAANLGVLTPTLTLCIAIAIFFERVRGSKWMGRILTGIRPACVGLMLGVILSLCLTNYTQDGTADYASILIGLLSLYLIVRKDWGVPAVIGCNAALGMLFYGLPALL